MISKFLDPSGKSNIEKVTRHFDLQEKIEGKSVEDIWFDSEEMVIEFEDGTVLQSIGDEVRYGEYVWPDDESRDRSSRSDFYR